MALTKSGYKKRLLDDKISKYLSLFGAISIEGPKWCGKTWTALNHSESVTYVTKSEIRDLALNNPKYIFENKRPQLIDEWQKVPSIWDAVRHECDEDSNKGKFILTGSTTLEKDEADEIYHSGTGRIATMKMETMSLYESGDSSGDISIMDMLNGNVKDGFIKEIDLEYIADLIIRGGWPDNINTNKEDIGILPREYINSLITKDMHERKDKRRNKNIMTVILKSLARNESTTVSRQKIVSDIANYEGDEKLIKDRETVKDYLSVLDDLYITENQEAYGINYRSSSRVGKSVKGHFIDPSLACASLRLTSKKLMYDFNTFGLMFESLVIRDLRIYMNYLDGYLFHFRDNTSGDEVDAILEFDDETYAAVEIKLSYRSIDEAKESLINFYKNVSKKPKFMCIIVGNLSAVMVDEETGIYIIPITSLKP